MTDTVESDLVFRGADGGAVQSYREHCRHHWPMPGKRDGVVVIDIDMMARRYSPENHEGCFALLEFKYEHGEVTNGQRRCYRQLDRLLRAGDPDGREYRGAFVVTYRHDSDEQFLPISMSGFAMGSPVVNFDTADEFDACVMRLLNPALEVKS